jgi:hypothetical protein
MPQTLFQQLRRVVLRVHLPDGIHDNTILTNAIGIVNFVSNL